jgi:type IV pilus assembly protein PilA
MEVEADMENDVGAKGFTLIELLIVVAIIGILAAVAIPQFSTFRIKGYNAAAVSDLKNFRIVLESYLCDRHVYPVM